jgi:translation initiation factor 3 subunit L
MNAIRQKVHKKHMNGLSGLLREKQYSDKMNKMQRGELAEFEACYSFACPKVRRLCFP